MTPSHIGQRIQKARTKLELSLQQLAAKAQSTEVKLRRIEAGEEIPNLPLLGRMAQALHVHPFALLAHESFCHSELMPANTATAGHGNGRARILSRILASARLRARLDRATAASHLGFGEEELAAIEMGYALPGKELLVRMAELYPVDEKRLVELAALEKEHPAVSERLALMENLLVQVRDILQARPEIVAASPELELLCNELAGCLGEEGEWAGAAERKAGYFSIGHLSDRLLRALQDPGFHEKAEALAREWKQKRERENEEKEPPPAENGASTRH